MGNNKKKPPFLHRIFRKLVREEIQSTVFEAFEEKFRADCEEGYKLSAYLRYLYRVLTFLLSHFIYSTEWSFAMIKNYLKVAFRNIRKHKGYSFINISGFAIGIACCILILLWVQDEISYDKHFENVDRIYRVGSAFGRDDNLTYYAKAPWIASKTFTDEIPGIKFYVRLLSSTAQLAIENTKFDDLSVLYTESDYFDIFSHKFLKGNKAVALIEPNSIVLTEETASKLFGAGDPMGKTVKLNQNLDLKVTGIIKNVPNNTHFTFDFVVPVSNRFDPSGSEFTNWLDITGWSYLLLEKGADVNEIESKIPALVEKYVGELSKRIGVKLEFFLQKLTDIHLKSHLRVEIQPNGDINYVYVFSLTAFLILFIACINFMNLSTAKSSIRRKEVGLRKVFGAYRKNIIKQFLGESALVTVIGILAAVILVIFTLPWFNNLTGKNFGADTFKNLTLLAGLGVLLLFTVILSGSYPAFFLSSFQPIAVLREQFSKFRSRSFFRNILVIFQFVIAVFLFTCTLIILKQINFMKNKDLGFNKEQIMVLRIRGENIPQKADVFKKELKQHPAILEATYSSGVPGRRRLLYYMVRESNTDDPLTLFTIFSDIDFVKTYKFAFIEGRDFSREYATDVSDVYIINETAAKELGWRDKTIGKRIGFPGGTLGPIIGVVKDFNFESLKEEIKPLIITVSKRENVYLSLKLNTENISETISFIENKWKEFESGRDFGYFFVDKNFNSFYTQEERTREILNYFSVFTIFITCLGLFGLASFIAERKTKEIGIRKVLGAYTSTIVLMLSKKFVTLIAVSIIISSPFAYFAMKKWLENFAYRTDIGLTEFAVSSFLALVISLISTGYQAVKAASSNPANSLRNE